MNFDELIFKTAGPVVLIAIIVLVSLSLAIKTNIDIKDRSNSKVLHLLLPLFVLLTSIPGYLLYLVIRPSRIESYIEEMERKYLELEIKGIKNCSQCDTLCFADDMFCKTCGNQIRKKCIRCTTVVEVTNFFCNSCGLQQIHKTNPNQKPSLNVKEQNRKENRNISQPNILQSTNKPELKAAKEDGKLNTSGLRVKLNKRLVDSKRELTNLLHRAAMIPKKITAHNDNSSKEELTEKPTEKSLKKADINEDLEIIEETSHVSQTMKVNQPMLNTISKADNLPS